MGRTDITQFLSNNPLGKMEGVTNRCFVKQELCLYPFPHLSHLSSLPLRTRIPFCDNAGPEPVPSLARRFRGVGLTSGAWPSTMALPFSSVVLFPAYGAEFSPALNPPALGRLLGGLGYAGRHVVSAFPWSFGKDAATPEAPNPLASAACLMACVTAAMLAPEEDMLLRRVIRC